MALSFPVQPNLAALQNAIINDLNRGDTSLSDIILLDIQSAITQYETQRFYFNDGAVASLTLSVTNTYALSLWVSTQGGVIDDIIEIDSIQVTIGATRNYTLIEKPYRYIDDLDQGAPTLMGYPQYFAIWNQSVRVYPKPSAALVLAANMSAHVRFANLNQPTDMNPWTVDGADLIRNATLKRLYARRFRDYDGAQAVGMLEQDALLALQRRTEALAGSRIRPVL